MTREPREPLAAVERSGSDRSPGTPPERLFLGALGKHPAWEDFWSLGLETAGLNEVWRTLFVEGIGGNLQAGRWGDPQSPEVQDRFQHVFLWWRRGDLVVGRLWPSRDHAGRRYPMVVCFEGHDLSIPWVMAHLLPGLEEVGSRCCAASSAAAVEAILDEARRRYRRLAQEAEAAEEMLPGSPQWIAELADRPEMAQNRQGLHRILYRIETELADFAPGRPREANQGPPPRLMRVPPCAAAVSDILSLWTNFALSQLGKEIDLLVVAHPDESSADIVVGRPRVDTLRCLLAGLDEIPLTTHIPYGLDAEHVQRTERLLAAAREGYADEVSIFAGR